MRTDDGADEVRTHVGDVEALLEQALDVLDIVRAVGVADEDGLVLLRLDADLLHFVHERAERGLAAARLAHRRETAFTVGVHDRLDAEHRADQCRRGAHAAAALEMIQIVHDKPVVLALDDVFHIARERVDIKALFAALPHSTVEQHSLSTRGGEGVDHDDLCAVMLFAQVACSDTGGLIGGGQCAREADAENVLLFAQHFLHRVGELADIDRGGRAVRARGDLLEEFLRGHIRMVRGIQKRFALDGEREGQDREVELLDLLLAQIAAAIGHDDIITHGVDPPFRDDDIHR